ncbi:superinfection immunity protein [Telmatobacter bradus]
MLGLLFTLLVFAVAVAALALPPWLAYRRRSRDTVLIGLVSIFLGWSVLGWIAALLWALYGPAAR